MAQGQLDLTTKAPESFNEALNLQVAPYHAPQIRPSGLMGPVGRGAFFATQLLEGISKGKAVAYARKEDQKNRQVNAYLKMAEIIGNNPDLTDEQRMAVNKNVMQVLGQSMQGALSGEKGKKGDKVQKDTPIGKIKEFLGTAADRMAGGPYKSDSEPINLQNALGLLQVATAGPGRRAQLQQAQDQMYAAYREVSGKLPPGQMPTPGELMANPKFEAASQALYNVDAKAGVALRNEFLKGGTQKPNERATGELTGLKVDEEKTKIADKARIDAGMKKLNDWDQRIKNPAPALNAPAGTAPAASSGPAAITGSPSAPQAEVTFSHRPDDDDVRAAIAHKPTGFVPAQNQYLLDDNGNPIQALDNYLPGRYQIRGTNVDVLIKSIKGDFAEGSRIGPLPRKPSAPQIKTDFDPVKNEYFQIERSDYEGPWKASVGPDGKRIIKPYNAPPDNLRKAAPAVASAMDRMRAEYTQAERDFTRRKQAVNSTDGKSEDWKTAQIADAQVTLDNRKNQIKNSFEGEIGGIETLWQVDHNAMKAFLSPPADKPGKDAGKDNRLSTDPATSPGLDFYGGKK